MSTISIRFDHVRLDVRDIAAAEAFYTTALGLRRVVRYETDDTIIVQLAPEGRPAGVELWTERGLTPQPSATQHIAFSVSDVPALVEKVCSLGYRITRKPFRIGAETVAFAADTDGHLVEFNDFRGRGVAEAGG